MRISGTCNLDVPRQALWDALQDPAVLARTLPGCEQLEVVGEDAYAATLTAGVASIKGTYTGSVQLSDKQPPGSYRLRAEGSGGPGTIRADATLTLEDDGVGTLVRYDADAVVGGMLGGVGQRMIAGAARKTAGEFFAAVAADIRTGGGAAGAPAAAAGAPAAAAGPAAAPGGLGTPPPLVGSEVPAAPAASTPQVGQVFAGSAAPAAGEASRRPTDLLVAFALGAAAALLGVLVGRRTARDRR